MVYAVMLPVMLLIPRHLLAETDGQADPEAERKVAEEIARTALSTG